MTSSTAFPTRAPAAGGRWLGDPRRCLAADAGLLALGLLTTAVCLAPGTGVARPLLLVLSACLIPGAALLTRLPAADLLEAGAIALAASLCLEAVGALAMIWTGWWHPVAWAVALGVFACVLLTLDLRRVLPLARGARRR